MIESKYLKDDIKNIQQLLNIPIFKSFESDDLSRLLKLSKIRRYEDGEVIIQEGEADHWLYFLLTGKARISKKGIFIGRIEKTGDFFGEMRFIDGLTRSASVHAEGQTICLGVNVAAQNRLAPDEATKLLLVLYKMVSESNSIRLRITNENYILAKEEISRLKNSMR